MTLRFGSLFAGIGGFDIGLERAGMTCAWQVEVDPWCRNVLQRHWPEVPKRGDIRLCDATNLARVDLLCGGFPCQDVSCAGKGAGVEAGHRSGLWREYARLVRELRPDWVVVENVPGLRTRGADRVLGDLEAEGYACWPLVVGARHVGAPHRRDRVWIVARLEHTEGDRGRGALRRDEREAVSEALRTGDGLADTGCRRSDGWPISAGAEQAGSAIADGSGGLADPSGQRTGDAIQHGPDRGADFQDGLQVESRRSGVSRGVGDADGARREGAGADAHEGRAGSRDGRVAMADAVRGRSAAQPGNSHGDETPHAGRSTQHDHELDGHGQADQLAHGHGHGHGRERERPAACGGGASRDEPDRCREWGLWPARPGEPQHDWEPPRTALCKMGREPDGLSNKLALKALGNAIVPAVAEQIGRAILATEAALRAEAA